MRYVIGKTDLAVERGFDPDSHRTHDDLILLNEKEVVNSKAMTGNLEERAKCIMGSVLTHEQTIYQLNEGGWNK